MSVKIYLIGAAYRTDRLARKLGDMIGAKPFLADGRSEAEMKEAASEDSWVIYGSSFTDIEYYLRAAGLIAVVSVPTALGRVGLTRLPKQMRERRRTALGMLNSSDGRAKLGIRLNHFSYKVRRVGSALSRRRLVREVKRTLAEARS